MESGVNDMDKFEKLVLDIMAECEADGEPVTRAEAEEMAQMEIGAKEIKNYVQSEPEKKTKKPREKKIDADKKTIIELLYRCLTDNGYSATIVNIDKAIDFDNYTLNLVKHRPKK